MRAEFTDLKVVYSTSKWRLSNNS